MKRILKKIIPSFIIDFYHIFFPFLGALIYLFPSKKIQVIGVTGTNGKTTTVKMIHQIMKEAGHKVAYLSSVKFQIDEEEKPNLLKMTMPGRMIIQRFIREAVNKGCDYLVIEVSSEGIKQHRHRFIDFDRVLITNLSPEHIEAHKGFDNYKKAKGDLFRINQKIHIVNLDDEHSNFFLSFKAKEKIGYAMRFNKEFKGKKVQAKNPTISNNGISFQIDEVDFRIPIIGKFNIYNALAAISVATSYEIPLNIASRALSKIATIPGRMEEVISSPFKVLIDYAVTPQSLEELYKTVKEIFPQKRMIAVLGSCGGGRDRWKRDIMGRIAATHCDQVIVTNEDPYDEDPLKIIEDVAQGAGKDALRIEDRREAIRRALSLAEKEDIIIITGKGSEPWICLKDNKKMPWNEREVVQEEFEKLNKEK